MGEPVVLVVSTMFPNQALPVHAVFVQQRIQALARRVRLQVCSPVPWFPLVDRLFAKYRHRALIPKSEHQGGVQCHFPRFRSVPGFMKPADGPAVYRAVKRFIAEQGLAERIQLIDAHLAFPDGWAAVKLGKELNVPVTVTLRGHDINALPSRPGGRGPMVLEALNSADRYIGVARALCDEAVALGAPPENAVVSSNGVDPDRFHPMDRDTARAELGLPTDRRIVLSVGHMVRRKGFHQVLEACAALRASGEDDLYVVLVGAPGLEGNYTGRLRQRARDLGMEDHVHFAGAVVNPELKRWYNAADVFCLASTREGWPNVVLESMACGVPVVATAVWGTPEIICRDELGILTEPRDSEALAAGLKEALSKDWDSGALRAYALEHTWEHTADGLVPILESVVQGAGRSLPRVEGGPVRSRH